MIYFILWECPCSIRRSGDVGDFYIIFYSVVVGIIASEASEKKRIKIHEQAAWAPYTNGTVRGGGGTP